MARPAIVADMDNALTRLLGPAIAARTDSPEAEAALVARLAEAAGIEPGTVRQILTGQISRPPDERLRGFARVLDLSFEALRDAAEAAAANAALPADVVELVAVAINAEGAAAAPAWVQLTPAGPRVEGRDGRAWRLGDPEAVVAAFRENGADLPVDVEHATQIKGAAGEPAPAVGWIREIEARNGAIWGRVDWTDDGARHVATRAYRYLSPVFAFAKGTGEVLRMISAGLTNLPNLKMAALNREGLTEEDTMIPEAITAALGLAKGADAPAVETAINRLKASAAQPDLTSFVPRADYDQAINRARTAEDALAAKAKADQDAAINRALDEALEAGKIAPASREFYEAACRAEGGLDKFAAFVASAPAIAAPAPKPAATPGTPCRLTAEEQAVCRELGLSEADFLKSKAEEAR